MNTLIAFACLLAVATAAPGAGYAGLGYAGLGYSGLGYSGLGYNGLGYAGPYANNYNGHYAHAAPLAYASHAAPIALASEARLIDPVAIAAGAPLPTGDTIEVAAAKAAHLQAHAVETARNYGAHAYNGHYAHAAPIAYAQHAAPLAYAHHASPLAYGHHAAPIALASEARLIDPVAIAAGAPLPTGDTIEVAAAKAAHLQAHAAASHGHFLRYKRGLAYTALAHPIAYNHRAVAYNAPLVAAPHPIPVHHHAVLPVAHAYSAPIAHAYSAPISHALSYSSVATHHVSHPYAYGHHY